MGSQVKIAKTDISGVFAGRHSFAVNIAQSPADNATIRRVHERAIAPMQDALRQAASADVTLTLAEMRAQTFADWQADTPAHLAISLFPNAFGKHPMLMAFSAPLITALVDGYYGGKISPIAKNIRSLSRAEKALAARLAKAMAPELAMKWHDLATVTINPAIQFNSLADVDAISADVDILIVAYDAECSLTKAKHSIHIIYVLPAIAPFVASENTPAIPFAAQHNPAHAWQDNLGESLSHIRLPLRSVLARPLLSVSQLLSLRVGDVLPIAMPSAVPLLVDGTRFAMASIGETAGQAAVRIESLCSASDGKDFQTDFVEM